MTAEETKAMIHATYSTPGFDFGTKRCPQCAHTEWADVPSDCGEGTVHAPICLHTRQALHLGGHCAIWKEKK